MKKLAVFLSAAILAVSLVTPAFASTFTPSVEQKGSPALVKSPAEGNTSVAAAIVENGNIDKIVCEIPVSAVTVTPMSKVSKASEQVKNEMTQAYDSIAKAGSLAKAVPLLPNAENLIVRDLIHIQVADKYLEKMAEEHTVRLTFDLKLSEGASLTVMVFVDGEWVIVPAENVKVLANGRAVVALDNVGPVAFVVEKG